MAHNLDVFRVLVEGGATLDMRSSVRELNCIEEIDKDEHLFWALLNNSNNTNSMSTMISYH